MRKAIAVAAGIVVLLVVNWVILERERLLEKGRVVLLELAPVDPRSLMQGDYMALRFRAADQAFGFAGRASAATASDGRIVVKLDARGVGQYVRHDNGAPLQPDEAKLRYRVRADQVKFATNAFFFQEGTAQLYQAARFGEFRVAASGEMILTGLRSKDLEPLGASRR